MCPEYAIEVPKGNCSSTVALHLSSEGDASSDGRDQWAFDSENRIRSVMCHGMFITTHGTSGGGTQTVSVPANQLGSTNLSTHLSVQGEVSLQCTLGSGVRCDLSFHRVFVTDNFKRSSP